MKQTLLLLVLISASFGSNALAQGLYDRSTVQKIEIFFGFSDWDAQLDALATTTEDYLLADSVRINGVTYDSVGVKYKGNSSYNQNYNKNPIHIELDYVHGSYDYEGYTDIKLQNGYQDPSMIREVLSYAILEQYMDCPKANFANVYINGTLRGVYSNAESINKKFNGDHYYTSDGSFFKCNPVGGAGPGSSGSPDLKYLGTDSSLYASGYELKSDYGWNDLVNLTNTLNNNFSAIESKLDVDRALWMLAYNNVLVNLDSYSGAFRQNYYVYKDLNDRFVPTVWDLNMSFAGFPGGPAQGQSYTATTLDPFSNSTSSNHPLIVKMLADPTYKRMYMAHLRTILQEIFVSGDYLTTANSLRTTIDASVQADPYKFYTYTQFQNGLTTSVTSGGGPGGGTSIPGIQQLMDARVTYFQSNSDYLLSAPVITAYATSNNAPAYGETVTITATCSNESEVFLGYRLEHPLRFNRVQMFDDGMHHDGAAGDQVYGVDVVLSGITMEYYIYAQNTNAGVFSPARAEHEFHVLHVAIPLPASGDILINELMADNGSTAYDSNGESDDWVELYNQTATAKDLSGLYLSDDVTNLTKWQIPVGTAINAHDVLIFWADNDTEQSGLHTNFKLSASGESVILSDGTTIYDQVDFGSQTQDISYARCPDGGTFTFTNPTFDALNNCTLGLENLLQDQISIYPNPGNADFTIQGVANMTFVVYDLSGRQVTNGMLESTSTIVKAQNWQPGTYLVRVQDESGNLATISVIKY